MWELDHKESWVLKNWYFWTVMLEKAFESPLDCKEIKPVHLKEISPEYSLEGLILKLKLWYFGHLCEELTHWKNWCWEKLKAGRKGDDREWDGWMALPTQRTWVWVSSRSWWWTGNPGTLQSMGLQRVGLNWTDWKRRAWQPTPVFLLGESPWAEKPGGLQSMGLQRRLTKFKDVTHYRVFNNLIKYKDVSKNFNRCFISVKKNGLCSLNHR